MDISQLTLYFLNKCFKCNILQTDCFVTNWLDICTLERYYVQRMVQQSNINPFKR